MTEEIIIERGCIHCSLCYEDEECYLNRCKRLEQENKELKEENKQHIKEKQILNERLYCYAYEKDCHLVCKQQNCLLKDSYKYRSALEEILESAKFAQCLPCGSGNLEDCLNCNDDTTNNGQFCMEKRIHEIKTKCVEVLK